MKPNDTLHLVLNKKWFDMIDSSEKLEEYRNFNEYWKSRILGKNLTKVVFQLGYKKNAPRMKFHIAFIGMAYGMGNWVHWNVGDGWVASTPSESPMALNHEWGFEGKYTTYVIVHSRRVLTSMS